MQNISSLGSDCGTVGRAVAYETRGARFEYSHGYYFVSKICSLSSICIEKNVSSLFVAEKII